MSIRTLKKGSIATTAKTTAITVGTGNTADIVNAVVTNTSTSQINITVRIADGAGVETLVTVVKVPAGIGKSVIIPELFGGLNAQYSLSLQGSASTGFDYIIYGRLVNA